MYQLKRQHLPAFYEIELQEHLPEYRQQWFEGMEMRASETGTTLLVGMIRDQAELHGLLEKIRDLGLVLLSVKQIEKES